MSEERSWRDKGKRVVGRVDKAYTDVTRTLSGKNLEEQVTEYSELYTQVLLGLHRDLEAQDRKLSDYRTEIGQVLLDLHKDLETQGRKLSDYGTEIGELKQQITTIHGMRDVGAHQRRLQEHNSEIEALKRQVATLRTVRIIAIAALVLAVVSAGGALWAAL